MVNRLIEKTKEIINEFLQGKITDKEFKFFFVINDNVFGELDQLHSEEYLNLQNEKDDLEIKNFSLEQENEDLESDMDSLKDEKDTLNDIIYDLRAEIKELKKQIN